MVKTSPKNDKVTVIGYTIGLFSCFILHFDPLTFTIQVDNVIQEIVTTLDQGNTE